MAVLWARPLVMQVVLDGLERWVSAATGLRSLHAEQTGAKKPEPPYLSLEWSEKLAPTAIVDREFVDLPASATLTVTALEDGWAQARVNLAAPALQRDVGEPLSTFADRLAAKLGPLLLGRVAVDRVGEADITLTPVVAGDLYSVVAVEGVTAALGANVSARLRDEIQTGSILLVIVGAPATAEPGQAGDGSVSHEVVSALLSSLRDDEARELLQQHGIRVNGPPSRPRGNSRRAGAYLESRVVAELPLSVSTRAALAPRPVSAVKVTVQVAQDAVAGEVTQEIDNAQP